MKFEYSIGNSKIGEDTLIFNLSSATDCASGKTNQCSLYSTGKCYAFKAERMYPTVLPYRRRQEEYWKGNAVETIIEDLYSALIKHKRIKFVRINESGDLGNTEDLLKLVKISLAIPSIKFYTYTHNREVLLSYLKEYGNNLPNNLVINTSDFTLEGFNSFLVDYRVKLSKKYSYKEYKQEFGVGQLSCIGDCSKCSLCKVTHGKAIRVPLH